MAYIGELAVFEAGVAAPLDAVVGRQLPGALRLEEYDGLGEGVVVVEPAGGQRRLQGVAGEHQRREGQGDVCAHGAVLECAHGERRERPGAAGIWEHQLGGEGKRKGRAWIQEAGRRGCEVFGPECSVSRGQPVMDVVGLATATDEAYAPLAEASCDGFA